MRFLLFICSSLVSLVHADWKEIKHFAGEIHAMTGIMNGRFQAVADDVTIREKRVLAWFSHGNAMYSSLHNLVLINSSNFLPSGELKAPSLLMQEHGSSFGPIVATIYHEMGHAEWDILIEERSEASDKLLYDCVEKKMVPWIKKNEPKVDAWIAVQEIHGYLRGSVLASIMDDYATIVANNGIDLKTGNSSMIVENQVKRGLVTEKNAAQFILEVLPEGMRSSFSRPYRERIDSVNFEAKGVPVDLADWYKKGFEKSWFVMMYDHFNTHFRLPKSGMQILERLNSEDNSYRKTLHKARLEALGKLPNQAPNSVEAATAKAGTAPSMDDISQ